jgi:GTP cyclohydrolase I
MYVISNFSFNLSNVFLAFIDHSKVSSILESNDSQLDVEFDYFCDKVAPVSGYKSIMNYRCKIECLMTKTINHKKDFSMVLTVEVPITTLCPCSKEISNHSAHNQRSYVTVAIKSFSNIWIEEIVEMVESASSSELYPILKRVDEKYVTEKAYENPRFVEDIVRITADKLYNDSRISWFKIKSIHFESIHNHNAFAEIEYKE